MTLEELVKAEQIARIRYDTLGACNVPSDPLERAKLDSDYEKAYDEWRKARTALLDYMRG